ncbi:hypothetical protein D3C87_1288390 [compost metagenome]
MSTKMTIDYDAIMQGLTDAVEARRESAIWCNAEGVTLLKDFRTVGLIVPRQCGRTYCALRRLVSNERAMMIVANEAIRDVMASNYTHHCGLEMPAYTQARIYTIKEVQKAMKAVQNGQQDILVANINEIIVDDALYFFENVRRNQFYKWLHDRAGDEQIIFLLG